MLKQRSTHRKASHTCESTGGTTLRTKSPAARTGDATRITRQEGSDRRTPLTRDDIPLLIHEVVKSLARRGPHSHEDPAPVENTSCQLTQTNATVQGAPPPSNPVANNILTTEDIPRLIQQVGYGHFQKTAPLHTVSHHHPMRPPPAPSELFATHGIIINCWYNGELY